MDLFLGGGGHAMAAGCSFASKNYQTIVEAMEIYASDRLTPEDFEVAVRADVEVEPEEISEASVQDLLRMEPFGNSNDEPLFVARCMQFIETKATKNPTVAQLKMRKGESAVISGVIFGMGAALLQEPPNTTADVLFYPSEDEYRGRTTIKWKLKDYVPVSD